MTVAQDAQDTLMDIGEDQLSKRALLSYVNKLLQLQISRLEQCANGATYCQLLDAYFQGAVPMHKVNFNAKEEHDIWANYKVLQAAFVQLKITKNMEVSRLSRGHAADNLELLQWLFKFLRKKVPVEGYQPKQRRLLRKGGAIEEVPVPSCLAANFDFRRLQESQSPGSPVSGSNNKGRIWSSRDIIGGKVDVSHVVSRYKEGLAPPVLVARPKTSPLSPPEQVYYEAVPTATASLSTQTENSEAADGAEVSSKLSASVPRASTTDASTEPLRLLSTGIVCDGLGGVGVGGGSLAGAGGEVYEPHVVHQVPEPESSPTRTPDGAAVWQRGAATGPWVEGADAAAAASPSTEPGATPGALSPDVDQQSASSNSLGYEAHAAGARSSGLHLPPDAAALYLAALAANSGLLPFSGTEVLSNALDTAADALEEVQNVIPRLQQQQEQRQQALGSDVSLVYRGQLRSLLVATRTLLQHTALLLSDVEFQCRGQAGGLGGLEQAQGGATASSSARCTPERAAALTQLLGSLQGQFEEVGEKLQGICSAPHLTAEPAPEDLVSSAGAQLSTAPLDAVVKAVGQAQFALMQAVHRQAAALAASFLETGAEQGAEQGAEAEAGTSGRAAPTAASSRATRCLKLGGGLQLKKLRNGDVYRGHYHSGKKNGGGVYHFLNNDVYEGEFRGDRMDGHGVYTFSHEGRYEGQWQSAVYSGYGTETFSKGSTYYGQYSAGLRNGCGACRFFNGDYYEGSWANGLRDGKGMQQCTDDSNYVGEYVKGKRHGFGVYSFPNGDRYQGEYADDLPHGHGVYLFASGQKYEGEWSQGKKHGWSIYTVDNGQQFVGQWLDSKPQWIQALRDGADSDSDTAAALVQGGVLDHAPEGSAEDVPDEIQQLATQARNKAKQAGHSALACAEQHWIQVNPVGVAAAVVNAAQAAAQAQTARRAAMEVAMTLNLTVAIHSEPSQQQQQLPAQQPSNQTTSKQAMSKQEPSKEEPSKQSPSKQNPSKQQPSKQGPNKQEPSKQDPSKQAISKQDPSKQPPSTQGPSKQGPTKQVTSKQEPSKQRPSKQATSKQEPSKQEPGKQQPGKKEPSKQPASEQATSKQEPSEQDPSKQETSLQSMSKPGPSDQERDKQESSEQELSDQETRKRQPSKQEAS